MFHDGERKLQERAGVREKVERYASRALRDHLPEEHRTFYASLPFLVVAARDAAGRPWASLLSAPPGFVRASEPRCLAIRARQPDGDALASSLTPGADVGVLGIELSTRRRNRVNGRIATSDENGFSLSVAQSFGNCPKYITPRDWAPPRGANGPRTLRHGNELTAADVAQIRGADTLFLASGHRGVGQTPAFGMDASHRGGRAGFVDVLDSKTLVLPDYPGNNLFNTLGNVSKDRRVGFLFVDFETGGLLQLTGQALIDESAARARKYEGAQRIVEFRLDELIDGKPLGLAGC